MSDMAMSVPGLGQDGRPATAAELALAQSMGYGMSPVQQADLLSGQAGTPIESVTDFSSTGTRTKADVGGAFEQGITAVLVIGGVAILGLGYGLWKALSR